jgi:uncharacterized membrane protein
VTERGVRELVESWSGEQAVDRTLAKRTAGAVLFIGCMLIVMGGLAAAAWIVGEAIVDALARIADG